MVCKTPKASGGDYFTCFQYKIKLKCGGFGAFSAFACLSSTDVNCDRKFPTQRKLHVEKMEFETERLVEQTFFSVRLLISVSSFLHINQD